MGRKALFGLSLRLSCGPFWDFSDSLVGELLRTSPIRSTKFAPRFVGCDHAYTVGKMTH